MELERAGDELLGRLHRRQRGGVVRFRAEDDELAAAVGGDSRERVVRDDQRPGWVSEIARRLKLQRQSVQPVADLLVEEGLAIYEDNPRHRRAKLLSLTAKGRRVLERIDEAQAEWAARLGERIGATKL